MLNKSTRLVHLIDDKVPPATHDIREVARIVNRRCYPHTGTGGNIWCLTNSLSLPTEFPSGMKIWMLPGPPNGGFPSMRMLFTCSPKWE